MVQKKSKNGVTLVALVITIVVVFIIAGISLSALTGQMNGITKGEQTKTEVNVDEERNALSIVVQETMNSNNKGEIEETPCFPFIHLHRNLFNFHTF